MTRDLAAELDYARGFIRRSYDGRADTDEAVESLHIVTVDGKPFVADAGSEPRYRTGVVSVGDAGLAARPSVYDVTGGPTTKSAHSPEFKGGDSWPLRTVKVYRLGEEHLAAELAEKLNLEEHAAGRHSTRTVAGCARCAEANGAATEPTYEDARAKVDAGENLTRAESEAFERGPSSSNPTATALTEAQAIDAMRKAAEKMRAGGDRFTDVEMQAAGVWHFTRDLLVELGYTHEELDDLGGWIVARPKDVEEIKHAATA